MIKVAINGFGRIGRSALKIILTKKNMQIVAINDLGDINNMAYLMKYDTAFGRYDKAVKVEGSNLVVAGKKIPYYSEMDLLKLPWKKHAVDVVLECTGVFTKKEDLEKHLQAGAKKVVLSAPAKSEGVATVVCSVNNKEAKGKKIIANASCTTNCVAPIMSVLEEKFGIEKAMLSTVHALTATQKTVDSPDKKDWRRGRAAGFSIIPSTTGAAEAVALTIPSLKGIFDGLSLRVPMITGSISDIVAVLKKNTTVEELNKAFIQASKSPRYKGVLEVTTDEIVSADIVGTTASTIVDLKLTKVVGGNLVKILAWYDNEWGYSNRLVEMIGNI